MTEKLLLTVECPECQESFDVTVLIKKGVAGKSSFQGKCPYCDEDITIPLEGMIADTSTTYRKDP